MRRQIVKLDHGYIRQEEGIWEKVGAGRMMGNRKGTSVNAEGRKGIVIKRPNWVNYFVYFVRQMSNQ